MLYPEYKFMVNPIIVGALGNVPKCLSKNLSDLGFDNREIKKVTQKLQNISAGGTVKIVKTFLKFAHP